MFVDQFDNILMEEAAQILEIETFIPLLLQVFVCHEFFVCVICNTYIYIYFYMYIYIVDFF